MISSEVEEGKQYLLGRGSNQMLVKAVSENPPKGELREVYNSKGRVPDRGTGILLEGKDLREVTFVKRYASTPMQRGDPVFEWKDIGPSNPKRKGEVLEVLEFRRCDETTIRHEMLVVWNE